MPEGSVEMTRVKGAQDLVNERLYRTRPEDLKFTCIVDSPEVVLAKTNSLQISDVRTVLLLSFHFVVLFSDEDNHRSKWAVPLQRL